MQALVQKGCNGGLSLAGTPVDCTKDTPRSVIANSPALAQGCAYASDIVQKINNLPDNSLQGTKVVIGVCSNSASECIDNCPGVNCPVTQAVQAAMAKGAGPDNIYIAGVGNAGYLSGVNPILEQVAQDSGTKFAGVLPAADISHDGVHFNSDGLDAIMSKVGEIEPSGGPPIVGRSPGDIPITAATNGDYYSGICNMESRCGQIATPANRNYCDAQGPGQYICDTWAKYANESGHSDLADPSNRFKADAVKIVTNDWYKNIWEPQNAGSCTAANLDLNTCSYFFHWNGNMNFVNALPSLDPNASVSTICGSGGLLSSCQSNPSLVYQDSKTKQNYYTVGDMVQNISKNVGGTGTFVPGPSVAAKPVAQPLSDIVENGYTASPSISSGSGGFGSMFNNPMLGYGLGSSLMSPFQNLFKPANASPYQTTQTTAAPPPAPTLSLTVQPLSVVRGNSITVSWTSSGMSLSAPCTVTQNGTRIGQGNAGAITAPTSASSTAASIVFRLLCQASSNGQLFQQSSTALFQ